MERKIRSGWRGLQGLGGATEGMGLYVAHDQYTSDLIAGPLICKISYYEPQKPLLTYPDPLYFIQCKKLLIESVKADDSDWTKFCKLAYQKFPSDKEKHFEELTRLIKDAGYDAVRAIWDDRPNNGSSLHSWDVLFNPDDLVIEIGERFRIDENPNLMVNGNPFLEEFFGGPPVAIDDAYFYPGESQYGKV